MIDWLKSLFCMHEYKKGERVKHFVLKDDGDENTLGFTYIQQCTKCGRLNRKRIKTPEFWRYNT